MQEERRLCKALEESDKEQAKEEERRLKIEKKRVEQARLRMRVGKNQPIIKDMLGTKSNPKAKSGSSRNVDTCQEGGQGERSNRDILKEYTSGTETVLSRLIRPDWKNSQASECGKVSGPMGAL